MRNNYRTKMVKNDLTNSLFCDQYLSNSNFEIDMEENSEMNPTDITICYFTLKHSKSSSIQLEENLDISDNNGEFIGNSFLPKQFEKVDISNNSKSIKYFLNNINSISI